MENVYLYGPPNGQPLTETHPDAAHTKKGKLRAGMARELLSAQEAGRVQVAIGRASDYFGPRGGAQSILGDRVIPAALAGKTATVIGDPDQPHTYTTSPTSAKAWPRSANTLTPRVRSGTSQRPPDPDHPPPGRHHLPAHRPAQDQAPQRPSIPAASLRRRQPDRPGSCSSCSTSPGTLHRRQHQDRTKLDVHATPLDQALADTVASYQATTS
jgi:hypothetical protein